MGVFYKAVLAGTYQGQAINNILYYGQDDFAPFSIWDEATAADLGGAIETILVPDYLPPLPSTYTLNSIVVTGIDERGNTVSDFEVETAIAEPGGTATNSEGQAQVAIIAFQTTTTPAAGRNVKRSYLAYGPLHDSSQSSDGSIDGTYATGLVDLIFGLAAVLTGSISDFGPVRVARTVAPAPIAIGRVVGVTLRPYASFRKSRKRRPTG